MKKVEVIFAVREMGVEGNAPSMWFAVGEANSRECEGTFFFHFLDDDCFFPLRFVFISIKNSLVPNDVLKTVINSQKATRRKENFLVSWSRSTSASSIYR